jgi:hypothetical protein
MGCGEDRRLLQCNVLAAISWARVFAKPTYFTLIYLIYGEKKLL